jgi:phage-related protein
MSLLTSLTTTIIGMAPQLMDTAMLIVLTLLDGLTVALPLITQALADMIPQLVAAYTAGMPQVLEGAVQLFLAIVDAIGLILPPLLEALPLLFMTIIDSAYGAFPDVLQAAVNLLMAIVKAIPILISALLPAIPTIVDSIITGLLDCLPVLIDGAITLLFGILEAIPEIAAALYESAPSIVASIVKGILQASVAIVKAGVQLMEGLIKGILSYDYMGKLKTVGDGIVKGFKKIFDIHSPSRVMAGIGEMLDEGLAAGIEDNAGAAVDAFGKLSDDMLDEAGALDGLTLERRMNHTFSPSDAATPADGISAKLDRIYQAILRGQVIMLDGKTLVGSTADRYDTELGQRRVLAERGAL